MGQYLALPLNKCTINVGYKEYAPGYKISSASPKSIHYGVDFIGKTYSSDNRFFASGRGVVVGVNHNERYVVGKWVAIKYYDVAGYGDLIARYYHMARVDVSVGQSVSLNTVLGVYGSTGNFSTGNHIHLELDKDITYWNYTPTLSGNSGCGLKKGYRDSRDTTVNPLFVLKRKVSAPEYQTCSVYNDGDWCYRISLPGSFQ